MFVSKIYDEVEIGKSQKMDHFQCEIVRLEQHFHRLDNRINKDLRRNKKYAAKKVSSVSLDSITNEMHIDKIGCMLWCQEKREAKVPIKLWNRLNPNHLENSVGRLPIIKLAIVIIS